MSKYTAAKNPRTSTQVHIGNIVVDEAALHADLERLRHAIEAWARRRQLWLDTSFHEPFHFRRERPRRSEVLLIISEGPLGGVLARGMDEKYEQQFCALLEQHGFWYSLENHYTISLYPEDDKRQDEFLILARWRWVQQLARKRLLEIHTEVFEHFAARPEDLKRLSWRQYEELLDAIFKNQGFVTQLGPGRNDGGVDLRLYQSVAAPELVTLVQAKRYTRRPIGLESVAALLGLAAKERALRGIFATTSRFLPGVQKFARSIEGRVDLPQIELADSGKVAGWCSEVAGELSRFYSTGANALPHLMPNAPRSELLGRILVASEGYDMTINCFAVIEADFPHEAILRPIGAEAVSGDNQSGQEIPKDGAKVTWVREARFTAFKERSKGSRNEYFRSEHGLFSLWNGQPCHFNYCD
jgi:hypothetical protein